MEYYDLATWNNVGTQRRSLSFSNHQHSNARNKKSTFPTQVPFLIKKEKLFEKLVKENQFVVTVNYNLLKKDSNQNRIFCHHDYGETNSTEIF